MVSESFIFFSLITFSFSLQMISELAFLPVINPGWILIIELNLLMTVGTVDSTILSVLAHKYCMSVWFLFFFLRALRFQYLHAPPFKFTHIFIANVPHIFFTKLLFSNKTLYCLCVEKYLGLSVSVQYFYNCVCARDQCQLSSSTTSPLIFWGTISLKLDLPSLAKL